MCEENSVNIQKKIEEYNDGLVTMLNAILQKCADENSTAYYFDFDSCKNEELNSGNMEKEKSENRWINYYWIETKIKEKEYKISLFYKNIDLSSGNVHVIPGAIQFWQKDTIGEKSGYRNCTLYDLKKIQIHTSTPYEENDWIPILAEAFFPCQMQIGKIIDKFFAAIEKNELYSLTYPQPEFNNCFPVKMFDDVANNLVKALKNDEYIRNKGKSIKIRKYSVSKKYSLQSWIEIAAEKEQWLSLYETRIYKVNEKYEIYAKYGKAQFWNDIIRHGKNPKGPNEYKNGEWIFYYPEKVNTQKAFEPQNNISDEEIVKDFISESWKEEFNKENMPKKCQET